jgi:hypothetical protein
MEPPNPTQKATAPIILSQEEAEKVVQDLSENKLPEPSPEVAVAEEIMKGNPVTEMPSPAEVGKIAVAPPNQPTRPQPPPQKTIHLHAQMEYLSRTICKSKGHTMVGIVLHTSQIVDRPILLPGSEGPQRVIKEKVSIPNQNTIVICSACGASLAQIRGTV